MRVEVETTLDDGSPTLEEVASVRVLEPSGTLWIEFEDGEIAAVAAGSWLAFETEGARE